MRSDLLTNGAPVRSPLKPLACCPVRLVLLAFGYCVGLTGIIASKPRQIGRNVPTTAHDGEKRVATAAQGSKLDKDEVMMDEWMEKESAKAIEEGDSLPRSLSNSYADGTLSSRQDSDTVRQYCEAATRRVEGRYRRKRERCSSTLRPELCRTVSWTFCGEG